jgi:hypothetical protein
VARPLAAAWELVRPGLTTPPLLGSTGAGYRDVAVGVPPRDDLCPIITS